MNIIDKNKGHLLKNLSNLPWLSRSRLQYYAEAIAAKGAPIKNCWGFIDGTTRPICRSSHNQQDYYSGHKHYHCVKYQSVLCPDGIFMVVIQADDMMLVFLEIQIYIASSSNVHLFQVVNDTHCMGTLHIQLENCCYVLFPADS